MIMLGKGNEEAAVQALQAFPGGLQAGGGIHVDNALFYLEKGLLMLLSQSYLFHHGALDEKRFEKACSNHRKGSIGD